MSNTDHSFKNLPSKCLVDNLKLVQITARLASNAASGSGDADLYIQVRDLLTQIKDVFDNCALVASQFTQVTASVMNNLEFAFDMLLQAQEEVATDILSDLYYIARQAQQKAQKLAEDIKKKADSTVDYLGQRASIKKLEKEYESTSAEVLDKEIKRATKLVGFYSTLFSYAGPTESDIERAENRRTEIQESLENALDAQIKLGIRVLEQLTKEKKDNLEEIIKGVTVECLENVLKGVAHIFTTLQEMSAFWIQISYCCGHLSQDITKDIILKILGNLSEEKRKEFYTMATFQNKATKYYAQWVTLHDVSFDFGRQIRIAQKGVFNALAEAPTRKQGIINAKEIAKQFSELQD